MTALTRLQRWYRSNCDGEWEHAHGICIQTLDNPGWLIDIELIETPLADVPFERNEIGTDDENYDDAGNAIGPWHECWRDDKAWHAGCGPASLEVVVTIFLNWAEGHIQ